MTAVTMTIKEAEAIEAELASLTAANQKLSAELATAKSAGDKTAADKTAADKTAADKTAADKTAGELADLLVSRKLVSSDKHAGTKAALLQEGGIASYFKKACDLYVSAAASLKEAEARLKEVPTRVGRIPADEKTASDKRTALQVAEDRFAQRVLAQR
jgi:hypothetical protein